MEARAMHNPRKTALESIATLNSVSPKAIKAARGVASMIERDHYPMPFVFPTDIGGIQFEWKGASRELNLEFLPEASHLAFLKIVDGVPDQEGEISGDMEGEIHSLLDWMTSATA
jgi:hypothetical protein